MGLLLEGYTNFLKSYGYLSEEDAENIEDFDDVQLTSAIEKFRRMDANVERQAMVTGDIVSATEAAMQMPRCSVPDAEIGIEAAIADGGWKECIRPREHGAIVDVDQSGMPSFLEPVFKQVLINVQKSYAEIGLLFIFRDKHTKEDMIVGGRVDGDTQTVCMFQRSNSWIGLALLGPFSCGRKVWAKFDPGYRPSNVVREWTTLVKHELGHNCGLRHTRGGVMNPSLVNGLPTSWKGDPHERTLRSWFGGEPVDIPGGDDPTPEPPNDDGDQWPDIFQPFGESFLVADGVRMQMFRVMGG